MNPEIMERAQTKKIEYTAHLFDISLLQQRVFQTESARAGVKQWDTV